MQRARARQAPYGGLGQPWVMPWGPGTNLSGLFNLYPSLGNVTLASDLATTLDGPMQVFRFGALTINTARTVTNRCRGAVILCDSLTMGTSGSFSMTARGAAGSAKWANQDILIPTSAVFSGKNTDRAAFFAYLAATGYAIFDPTLFACPPPGMGDVVADYASWPGRGTAIVSAAGCGIGAPGISTSAGGQKWGGGYAGVNAPGGGGCGYIYAAANAAASPSGAPGRVWGGGPGSGGCYANASADLVSGAPDSWGGQGGNAASAGLGIGAGAGNPGGIDAFGGGTATGTGGVLVIICRSNITVNAGHAFVANGVSGGATGSLVGGGSGGGRCCIYYGGSLSGALNMIASGGTYGGSGSCTSATFADMGWQ